MSVQTNFMKSTLRFLLLVSYLSLFFSACQREVKNDIPSNEPGLVVNTSPVTANLTGVVLDESGSPIAGVMVKAGGQTTSTNAKGNFRFNGIQLDKYNSVVKVEMAGYFTGIRTFSAIANNTNFVRIKLIKKVEAGTFSSSAGGVVTIGGSSITMPASAVVLKSNGQPYSGTVKVFAANIDPTQNDISQTVPGSFQATDANDYRVLLKSYGMIAVELEGSGGEPLQIATGKKATLKMTIPASLQGSAPATIPLWYLNETDGLWKEEGSGTKVGNTYEGEVSHFSFWNYDISNNAVYLEMTLITNEGPLAFTTVKITRTSTGASSYGYTDTLGHVGGIVFNNEPLKLEVLDNCQTVIYTQNIGPFTSATNLGNITVTLPDVNELHVTGSATNCSNQPITNGKAYIYFEGVLFVTPVQSGNFSLHLTRCTNSTGLVEVVVEDLDNNQQSDPLLAAASSGVFNTGNIQACGTSSVTFVNFAIDGGAEYAINSSVAGDSISAYNLGSQNYFDINAFKVAQPNINIWFGFTGNSVGSFPINLRSVNQYDSIVVVQPLNVNVTTFGAPGQFVEGSFNGQFKEGSASTQHTINCTFRVRRF